MWEGCEDVGEGGKYEGWSKGGDARGVVVTDCNCNCNCDCDCAIINATVNATATVRLQLPLTGIRCAHGTLHLKLYAKAPLPVLIVDLFPLEIRLKKSAGTRAYSLCGCRFRWRRRELR